jgi:hypothetical protein
MMVSETEIKGNYRDEDICPECGELYMNHSEEKADKCYQEYVSKSKGLSGVFDCNPGGG